MLGFPASKCLDEGTERPELRPGGSFPKSRPSSAPGSFCHSAGQWWEHRVHELEFESKGPKSPSEDPPSSKKL